jgi:hypothetical protein
VAATELISGVCVIAVACLIFVLDPYRRPWTQRIAGALWGGPVGAWLMGSPPAGAAHTGTTSPAARAVTASPAAAPNQAVGAHNDDRLDRIESRLEALERGTVSRSRN